MKTKENNNNGATVLLAIEICLVAILVIGIFNIGATIEVQDKVTSLQQDSNLVLSEVKMLKNDINQMVLYVNYSANANALATNFLNGCDIVEYKDGNVILNCKQSE